MAEHSVAVAGMLPDKLIDILAQQARIPRVAFPHAAVDPGKPPIE